MTPKKRITVAAILVGGMLATSAFWAGAACRPPMPGEWGDIRVDMPRAEALAHLPDGYNDLWELKGFDSSTHKTVMLGHPAQWKLLVFYDSAGKVRTAEASFTHEEYFGLFNVLKQIL
jgi:hypothetical protein